MNTPKPSTNGTASTEPATEESEKPILTEAAFLVYLDHAGHWVADDNVKRPVTAQRVATFNDFFLAAVTIQKDVAAAETANRVVLIQQQVAQHMARQVESAKIAQNLDLSKLRH